MANIPVDRHILLFPWKGRNTYRKIFLKNLKMTGIRKNIIGSDVGLSWISFV